MTIVGMRRLAMLTALALPLAGCGGGRSDAPPLESATTAASTSATVATTTAGAPPLPLTPEATSAATGDIPDNQVFLGFRNRAAGYAMKVPEGWARQGNGAQVTFHDKNNIVRIVVATGGAVTTSAARADVSRTAGATIVGSPQTMTLAGRPAVKIAYRTRSAPNAVTGKRVVLVVDRYYLWHGGKRAVLDLGTPQGVDNVDAYRLMSESFRWR